VKLSVGQRWSLKDNYSNIICEIISIENTKVELKVIQNLNQLDTRPINTVGMTFVFWTMFPGEMNAEVGPYYYLRDQDKIA
jgi:hypothetical protein